MPSMLETTLWANKMRADERRAREAPAAQPGVLRELPQPSTASTTDLDVVAARSAAAGAAWSSFIAGPSLAGGIAPLPAAREGADQRFALARAIIRR